MTTAQVVETSVTVNNNSPIQDYVHPDDQTQPSITMFCCWWLKSVTLYIVSVGYPYYQTLYQAPNGVILSTTGSPYCRKPHTRNPKKCDTDNSWLANLFLSTTDHYYTTHSSPIILYRFPLPLFLEYMLIYPHCSSDHWTPYYVRIYLGSSEVTGTNGWVDPTNCLQGQASRLIVRRSVDKVQCISFEIGHSLIKDSKEMFYAQNKSV